MKNFSWFLKKENLLLIGNLLYMTLKSQDRIIFELVFLSVKKLGMPLTRNRIKRYVRQTFHELEGQYT